MALDATGILVSEDLVQSFTRTPGILQSAKERTGFDSYQAYLRFHDVDTTAFARLCGPLRPLTYPREEPIFPHRKPNFQRGSAVLNLSEAGGLCIDEGYRTQDEEYGPGTDMVEALCHPPPGTKVQIAIWDTSSRNGSKGCEAFGDLIGLCYQLDPVVLRAIDANRAPAGYIHQRGLDRFAITHAKIGKVVTTVLRPKNGTNNPLLVLIAGPANALRPDYRGHRILESCPPFSKSNGDDKKLSPLAPTPSEYNFYSKELNRLLSKYHDSKLSVAECTLLCLLPLLHLSIAKVRHCLSVTRDHFEDCDISESDILYNDRDVLRTVTNDMESDWWSMRRYVKSCFDGELSEMRCYHNTDNEVKDFVEEASRLEGRVRENLQLRIGVKALEESKKSIEVSNQQIQEGKRLKTFTILAFVYVPLNLASSIYGMNIQQLNGNGQSVWVFVVTAVIALFITAGTWYLSEEANTYRNWHRRYARRLDRGGAKPQTFGTIAGLEQVPPDAVIFSGKNFSLAQNGELIALPYMGGLKSGRFTTTLVRNRGRFARYILAPDDHHAIGFTYVDRPVPDPDTLFDSFAQDPLLANIPKSLHPEINPASLLPQPTEGCSEDKDGENKCLVVIPSADVFYFGPEPTNTACIAAISTPPPSHALPQVTM
ncbi:MAG: hypothetical protein Q9215_005002 [Flavoplaca cf. flavocitrina]